MVLVRTWLRCELSHVGSVARSWQKVDLVTYCPLDTVDMSGLEPGTDCSGICPGHASDPEQSVTGSRQLAAKRSLNSDDHRTSRVEVVSSSFFAVSEILVALGGMRQYTVHG